MYITVYRVTFDFSDRRAQRLPEELETRRRRGRGLGLGLWEYRRTDVGELVDCARRGLAQDEEMR